MATDFAAGTIGGIAGVAVGYPADTVKVRLQSHVLDKTGKPLYRGTTHCFLSIIRQETALGLFRGMSSPIVGVGVINSLLFGVYGHFLRIQQTPEEQGKRPSVWQVFWAGTGSGFVNSFASCPIELAKIRMQNQAISDSSKIKFTGPLPFIIHTYRTSGISGCFRGLVPTIIRETPSYGAYFAAYEVLCLSLTPTGHSVDELGWPSLLLAGGLSGIIGWISIYPVDVIKTKMQSSPPNYYKGMLDCCIKSYQEEGWKVFFRGLNATLLRAFPTNAATLLVYTVVMRLANQTPQKAAYDDDASRTAATATAALE